MDTVEMLAADRHSLRLGDKLNRYGGGNGDGDNGGVTGWLNWWSIRLRIP